MSISIADLNDLYQAPPQYVAVNGVRMITSDPMGENDHAINFSCNGVSTIEGAEVIQVVEESDQHGEAIAVEIYCFPHNEGERPRLGNTRVQFETGLEMLADLEWEVEHLQNDEYLLTAMLDL